LVGVPIVAAAVISGFSALRDAPNANRGPSIPQADLHKPAGSNAEAPLPSSIDHGFVVYGRQQKEKPLIHFVWVDPNRASDPEVFERAITSVDKGTDFLWVLFWQDETFVPERLPMTDEQADAQIAKYERNRNTGLERFYLIGGGHMLEPTGRRPEETFRLLADARKQDIDITTDTTPAPDAPAVKPPEIRKTDTQLSSQAKHKHEIRIWKDSTGSFSTRASFISQTAQTVKLRREDGTEIEVEVGKLSVNDIEYIRSLRK
jgi:hypothetical protein